MNILNMYLTELYNVSESDKLYDYLEEQYDYLEEGPVKILISAVKVLGKQKEKVLAQIAKLRKRPKVIAGEQKAKDALKYLFRKLKEINAKIAEKKAAIKKMYDEA